MNGPRRECGVSNERFGTLVRAVRVAAGFVRTAIYFLPFFRFLFRWMFVAAGLPCFSFAQSESGVFCA